jgi:hypothetical protein
MAARLSAKKLPRYGLEFKQQIRDPRSRMRQPARPAQLAVDAAESLLLFPNRGHRLADPKVRRFRELLLGTYRLIYLEDPNGYTPLPG